jgi:hypothetical protein
MTNILSKLKYSTDNFSNSFSKAKEEEIPR